MSSLRQDPLLGFARILIGFCIGLLSVISAAMALLIVAAMSFKHAYLLAELAKKGIPEQGLTVVILLVALVVVLCGLGIFFLLHLIRIVKSVGESDPFNPVNANRLRAMAWLTLAAQPVLWCIGVAAHWFAQFTHKNDVDVGINLGGILLALVLFILARVFRTGTQMREELEGTV